MQTVKVYEKKLEEKDRESAIEKKLAKESSQEGLLLSLAKHNRFEQIPFLLFLTYHMQCRDFTEEQYHALQLELEDKERVIADLKKKADEQVKSEKELRKLRDNMDIMKEKVAAAAKTEEKFSRLQGKLEELAELKAQYKVTSPPPPPLNQHHTQVIQAHTLSPHQILQEQSNSYMKKSLDMEEEARKLPILKSQLEEYKQSVASLKVQAMSASGNQENQFEVRSFLPHPQLMQLLPSCFDYKKPTDYLKRKTNTGRIKSAH